MLSLPPPEISLILPTRDRSRLVQRLLRDILETVSDPKALEIILYLDRDDPETAKISYPALRLLKITGEKKETMGRITQICFEKSSGRIIALVNDDIVIRIKDWDKKIKEAFSLFPDQIGLVYPNDRYYGKKVATFPVMSRKTCELLGGICPAEYDRHCIDSHIFDVFERLLRLGFQRSVYLKEVVFEHMHYGLSLKAFEGDFKTRGNEKDQELYARLADDRQKYALELAEHIRSHSLKPSVSLLMAPGAESGWNDIKISLESVFKNKSEEAWVSNGVIVLDNDKMKKKITDFCLSKKIKFLMCPQGLSVDQRLNRAAKEASGEVLVFLDDGSVLERGFFPALLFALKEPNASVIGSKGIDPRNGRIQHAGIAFLKYRSRPRETFLYRGFPAAHPAVSQLRNLQAVARNGMLVKRETFLKLNGFRENFGEYSAFDLCFRARQLGQRVFYAPQAVLKYGRAVFQKISQDPEGERNLFLSSWKDQIEFDLERILAEDGFCLVAGGEGLQCTPLKQESLSKKVFSPVETP